MDKPYRKPAEEDFFGRCWQDLDWTKWIPLDSPLKDSQKCIPKTAGFYRVKSPNEPVLLYLGQTGRDLRERTRSLAKGVYQSIDNPPWNDPHTAAPLIWAYRHESGNSIEVSIAERGLTYSERQCFEDALLYSHRCLAGTSTLFNHGRWHSWWTRPSNRKKGVVTRRRKSPQVYPSLPPAIGDPDAMSLKWLGLNWSEYFADAKNAPKIEGIYRLTVGNVVVYLGESKSLRNRLSSHLSSERFDGCQYSYCAMPDAQPHHLKERETDMIGAYYLAYGVPPSQQYSQATK